MIRFKLSRHSYTSWLKASKSIEYLIICTSAISILFYYYLLILYNSPIPFINFENFGYRISSLIRDSGFSSSYSTSISNTCWMTLICYVIKLIVSSVFDLTNSVPISVCFKNIRVLISICSLVIDFEIIFSTM